ncbi:MAG: hypothetical protein ACK5JT_07620 [Hyphomicrobiaceae bacterium]
MSSHERDDDKAAEQVIARFMKLPELSGTDADLTRRGRFLTCDFEIGVDATPLLVSVENGKVASVRRGPFLLKSTAFAVRASADVWSKFLEPVPSAGWHDILALTKVQRARVEGNLMPFMGNLQYIKDLLALPRSQPVGGTR